MKQKTKKTRKRDFLDELNLVVAWAELVALIEPHAPARSAKVPSKRRAMDKSTPMGALMGRPEQIRANIRSKMEHPFRVIKRQFDYTQLKYRGLVENTANRLPLFALSNWWMARQHPLPTGARG